MTIGYAESLTAMCPVFWISIAYVNEKLNKISLEPKILQDIMLFTVIFYALYVCWKTGLEIVKSFKLESFNQFCRLSCPTLLLRAVSHTAGCSRLCLVGFWVSPKPEASQSLWETCSTIPKKFRVSKFKHKDKKINFPIFYLSILELPCCWLWTNHHLSLLFPLTSSILAKRFT